MERREAAGRDFGGLRVFPRFVWADLGALGRPSVRLSYLSGIGERGGCGVGGGCQRGAWPIATVPRIFSPPGARALPPNIPGFSVLNKGVVWGGRIPIPLPPRFSQAIPPRCWGSQNYGTNRLIWRSRSVSSQWRNSQWSIITGRPGENPAGIPPARRTVIFVLLLMRRSPKFFRPQGRGLGRYVRASKFFRRWGIAPSHPTYRVFRV